MVLSFEIAYSIITTMANKESKSKKDEQKKLHIEVVRQMITLATSGFGLVAALAWNELVKQFVEEYIKKWLPNGSAIYSLLIYALVVTLLAVTVTLQLSRLLKNLENPSKK